MKWRTVLLFAILFLLTVIAYPTVAIADLTPTNITFTTDSLIQSGDNYNWTYLYNGGTGQTTVEMTGGYVEALVLYDDSYFIKNGGVIKQFASIWDTSILDISSADNFEVYTHETSTFNLYSGGMVNVATIGDNSTANIYGGTIASWIRMEYSGTLNIFGGDFSAPPNFSFYYTVNPIVNVHYRSRTYTGGTYTGILSDGSPFFLDSSFNYIEVPDPAVVPVPSTILLGSLGLTFSGWLLKRQGYSLQNDK